MELKILIYILATVLGSIAFYIAFFKLDQKK
ncbi:MAG: hypothetical protein G01um101416_1075 [Microgenomates group bacterium Gr01-1014_16]|nr:MAG: hypothetical protein G01um101416_1075 [Microgenomates group bacterium Gr01-1014_16]